MRKSPDTLSWTHGAHHDHDHGDDDDDDCDGEFGDVNDDNDKVTWGSWMDIWSFLPPAGQYSW